MLEQIAGEGHLPASSFARASVLPIKEIKAAIKLKDSVFIRSGYSANADIVLDKRDSVLAIPESLITFSKDSAFVDVETAPQTFEKRYIKTGLSDGINIEILAGLDSTAKIKQPLALEPVYMPD